MIGSKLCSNRIESIELKHLTQDCIQLITGLEKA